MSNPLYPVAVADPGQPYKAIVAIVGAAITACLGLIPPNTTLWIVLTVASAALTAAAVYVTENPVIHQPTPLPPDGLGAPE